MEYNTLDSNLINENKPFGEEDIANSGKRFLNFVIDMVAIYILYFAFVFILAIGGHVDTDSDENLGIRLLIYLFMLFYYIIFEASTGKTLGKMITGTRVIRIDGSKPTFKTALVRALCRFIPFEAFSCLGTPCEGWHDTIADSRVVFDRSF
jgi:uncharacterized RDD family membrane protein YckC